MGTDDLERLPEYSLSIPTKGQKVGDGYRWKCQVGCGRFWMGEYVPDSIRRGGIHWREIIVIAER
jgi:hypothetical protein